MVWQGLGINYKAPQADWVPDIAYFQSIGLTTIRPHLSNFPVGTYTPGSEINVVGSIDWWRNCAKVFKDAGFKVVHGVARQPGSPFTATVWAQHRLNVLADAAHCQSLGLELDVYQIGNEIEGVIDGTTLTQTQLIANLKALATEVKAIYPLAKKIGYSSYDAGVTMFNNWIAAGLGNIDVLGGNVYSQTTASGRGFIFGDMTRLGIMLKTFGADRFTLTEFGVTANASEYAATSQDIRRYVMHHIYAGIRELGFSEAIVYSYVGYLKGDNQFALKNTDNTFDVQWGMLLADGGRPTITNTGAPISSVRTTAPARTATTARSARDVVANPDYYETQGNLNDNRVTPVDIEALRLGASGDFTLVMKLRPWAKRVTGNSDALTLCRLDFSFAGDKGYMIQLNPTTGAFAVWSGNLSQPSAAALFSYNVDQVMEIAITGTTATFYVNGVQVGSPISILRKADNGTSNIWFLTENGGTGASVRGFAGRVYEIMARRGLLTPTERAAIQQGVAPSGLAVHYKFNRGAGRWVKDLSGNNNHGLLLSERMVRQ